MQQITRIKCGNANCFCVEENGSAILIDTGWVQYRDRVHDACKDKNIRLIVITHGHVDHIQNAAALKKALNVPVAMHKDDIGLIANNTEQPLYADSLLGKVARIYTKRYFNRAIEQFEPDILLKDGDTLEDYGITASIIGLPGHTRGSIGVLAGGDNFFMGDALMSIVYPSTPPYYGNRAEMLNSARRISAYTSAIIYLGHGKSVPNRVW